MQEEDDKGLIGKIKAEFKTNVLLQALPYTFLISVLTIAGLFGGFALGKWMGCSGMACFIFFLSLSFLGFFIGLLITYLIVAKKYPMKSL